MRKLFMAVAILGISATVSFAKAQCVNENGNKEPFAVEFGKLSSYFKGQQKESLSRDTKRQEERLQKAVYGNLKLMKSALSDNQYRKYVTLLNVTNNNNRLTGAVTFTDIYLADNK